MEFKFNDNSDLVMKELAKKGEMLSQKTSLNQIITDRFVKENTLFSDYEDMMNRIREISPDYEITKDVNSLIAKNSKYSGFNELYAAAKEKFIHDLSE